MTEAMSLQKLQLGACLNAKPGDAFMRLRAWQLDDADDPIGLPLDIPITAVPCVVGRKTSRSEGADVSHFVDMDLSGRPLTNSHVRTPTRHVHVHVHVCT